MATTDLSARFGRSAAATKTNKSALEGLLPARPAPRPRATQDRDNGEPDAHIIGEDVAVGAPAVVAESSSAEAGGSPDTDPAPGRPPRRGAGRELRQAPAAQDQSQTHQTVVYVSAAAKAAAERRRKQHDVTNAEIVLDALDHAHDELPELLATRYTPR
ncbi:MAG: hypothetical protein ACRDJC_21680, partial [Thermomicrobiales bacterium]